MNSGGPKESATGNTTDLKTADSDKIKRKNFRKISSVLTPVAGAPASLNGVLRQSR